MRLPKSGADRDDDPGAGYGVRCEYKFGLANQNGSGIPITENRGHVLRVPPE